MAVARTDAAAELPAKDVWRFIGVLTFLDPPRFDTKQTIEEAMEMGVDVKMITGDNVLIAREVRREREKREERVFFFPSFSSFPFFSICSLARLRSSLRLHSLFSPPPLLVLSTPQKTKPNQTKPKKQKTARVLGMGTNIATTEGLPTMGPDGEIPKDLAKTHGAMIIASDGFAQVFPEHKYLIVEALRQSGFATGMTGDGVNDAPALKRADVGIAVSGATDAARAAADIVLTEPGLNTVVHAMIVARQIFRRINNFINYRVAATLQLLFFFFVAVFAFPPNQYQPAGRGAGPVSEVASEQPSQICNEGIWPNYFKLPVIMLMLITVLNDGTLISIG